MMWQALVAGFMLGRELVKYLRTKDECKLEQRKKALQLVDAARRMRKARKSGDAQEIEDIFRALNLDAPKLPDGDKGNGDVGS